MNCRVIKRTFARKEKRGEVKRRVQGIHQDPIALLFNGTLHSPLHGCEHSSQAPQFDHWPFWGGGATLAGAGQGGRSMHTISSWSWPTQTRPPNAGAGFVQVRRRVFIAKPQVWEQADQADQAVQPPWTVQFVTLTRAPVQLSPPCCGGGLLHSLVWHWHVSIFCGRDFIINFHSSVGNDRRQVRCIATQYDSEIRSESDTNSWSPGSLRVASYGR